MEFFKAWVLDRKILSDHLPGTNPTIEADVKLSEAAFEVMTACWKLNPNERPHMREVQARYHDRIDEERS
jgi:hypothetical protein